MKARDLSLEVLRTQLVSIDAAYETAPRPRTDQVKRQSTIKALIAVSTFLRAQNMPVDSLTRLLSSLPKAKCLRGSAATHRNRPAVPIRIRALRARLAAKMEFLMMPGPNKLGREAAARSVAGTIPRNGSI